MIAVGIDIGGTTSRVAAIETSAVELAAHSPPHGSDTQQHPDLKQDRGRKGTAGSRTDDSPSRIGGPASAAIRAVLALHTLPTPHESCAELIDWLTDRVRILCVERSIDSAPVGLALPGPVDRERGVLLRSVNLPFLEHLPLAGMLREKLCQPVTLWTDAEAATWGEYAVLDPRPSSFAHLRIGTGVACGIIVDGQFVNPKRTHGGHLDVLVVDHSPDAPPCPCGKRGCLEAIASGAVLKAAAESLQSLQRAYEAGDANARQRIQNAANGIRMAMVNLVNAYDSRTIVLGGGVIENLPALYREFCDEGVRFQFLDAPDAPSVRRHKLGDAAGVIGAAMLAARVSGSG